MLVIEVPKREFWNEQTEEFVKMDAQVLELEHSLVSVSKWEAKWNKPFLSDNRKTDEEVMDYIKCMTMNTVDPLCYSVLTRKNMEDINNYISAPMTATTFGTSGSQSKKSREIITSEVIYYWMIALNIPMECQHWHLSRLITLIRVCDSKSNPDKKKMSKAETLRQNRELNEARRQKLKSKG